MKLREEFEAWFKTVYKRDSGERNGPLYMDITASTAWTAWHGSRATLEVDLPQQSGANLEWNQAIRYCHQALKAAGVRVKK